MTTQHSATADETFYLIVTNHDRPFDRRHAAIGKARNHQHRITCGPAGPDSDALAAD